MMRNFTYILLSVLALGAVSCAREMVPSRDQDVHEARQFSCSMPAVKTVYDGANGAMWAAGDVVKVFDAAGQSDTYTIPTVCSNFTFNASVGAGPYYSIAGPKAVVDAATFNTSAKSITFHMGSEFDGTFASADVLVSTSNDTDLRFQHAYGIFEFEVSSARKVEFAATGACAESVAVTFDAEGVSTLTPATPSNKITVNPSWGGTHYFPVVPQTFASGFTLTAGLNVKNHPSSFTVAAGDVAVAGKLDNDTDACDRVDISDAGYLEVYYANKKNSKCVILYPGGGYSVHNTDGPTAAKNAFRDKDVTLIIDYFTLPSNGTKRDQSIADAVKALDLAWANKDKWGGYTKVGIIGNSAGGHLAGYIGQNHPDKVDFQILIYPVVTLEDGKTHAGTRTQWLGSDPSQELTDKFCNEKHVSTSTPPTYLAYSTGDPTVPQADNGKVLGPKLLALDTNHHEVHEYTDSQHSVNGWSDWPGVLYTWLDKLDAAVTQISTAEQFKTFLANAATAKATDTYVLTADIDLSGSNYTAAASFAGTLDGQNHMVSGIDKNIFGTLTGTVKNLSLKGNVKITSGPAAYGILANTINTATLSDVTNYANLTVNGGNLTIADMGALVGQATGSTIKNVYNYGAVTVTATNYAATTGGFGGYGGFTGVVGSSYKSTFSDCANHGEVKVTLDGVTTSYHCTVAGVVATVSGGGSFDNCDNDAPVSLEVKTASVQQGVIVGGVIGFNTNGASAPIANCDNSGDVTLTASSYPSMNIWIAGIVASADGGSVVNSTNSGRISVTSANAMDAKISGIAGQLGFGAPMTNCSNNGAIEFNVGTATNIYAGGAAGYVKDASVIDRCSNNGAIEFNIGTAGNIYAGGSVGCVPAASVINRCSNNAPITFVGTKTGALRVGGVVGNTQGYAVTKNLTNGVDGDISLTCGTVANCYSGGCVHGCWGGNDNGNYRNAGDITVNITNHTGNFLVGGCAGFAINSGTAVVGTLVNTGTIKVTLGTLGNTSSSAVGGILAARWTAASVTATMTDTGTVSCNLTSIPAVNNIAKVIN